MKFTIFTALCFFCFGCNQSVDSNLDEGKRLETEGVASNQTTDLVPSDTPYIPTWFDKAQEYADEQYIEPRLARCGESTFMKKKDGYDTVLYQTKGAIDFRLEGDVVPRTQLSEAERLNNKPVREEHWSGQVTYRFEGGPWRIMKNGSWQSWQEPLKADGSDRMNNRVRTRVVGIEYVPEAKKWIFYSSEYSKYSSYGVRLQNAGTSAVLPIGKYKCDGDDIELSSNSDTSNNVAQGSDLPDIAQAQNLVTTTLINFNRSVLAGDFTEFHRTVADTWKNRSKPTDFNKGFKEFIDKKIDISRISDKKANFSPKPYIKKKYKKDVLFLKGKYTTKPLPVNFNLEFIIEDAEWKLVFIGVDTRKK